MIENKGSTATYPTQDERLDAKARRLWSEQQDEFRYRGKGQWLVPSQTEAGVLYPVELKPEPSCGCIGWSYGTSCTHYRAAKLAHIRTDACAGCRERFPYRSMVEVEEGNVTFLDGTLLCFKCACKHGAV